MSLQPELSLLPVRLRIRTFQNLHGNQNTINDVMNNYIPVFQAKTEWFDFVCDSQGKVMIGQRHADAGTITEDFQEPGHLDAGTDIEVWVVVIAEELK